MNLSHEVLEKLVNSLDAAEFTRLKFAVNDRIDREEHERTIRIEKLKEGFAFTPAELQCIDKQEKIEVIKSMRSRLDLGLGDAKRLFDAMYRAHRYGEK